MSSERVAGVVVRKKTRLYFVVCRDIVEINK